MWKGSQQFQSVSSSGLKHGFFWYSLVFCATRREGGWPDQPHVDVGGGGGEGSSRISKQVSIIAMDVRKSIPFVTSPHIQHIFSFPEFVDRDCVFPFVYGDVTHYNCISIHSDYDWCSLDTKFQGRWRYCTGQGEDSCDGLSWVPTIQEAIDSSWLHDLGGGGWINLSQNPDFSTCFNYHFEHGLLW